MMSFGPAAAVLLLAAALPAFPADLDHTCTVAPPPAWVTELEAGSLAAPASGAQDAQAFLLVDHQTNVATEEQYTRIVTELRTSYGVTGGSSVQAWYDPSCQQLVFHHIRVIRVGVASSRLSRQAVQLLRRELSLESQVLDGSLTASVLLEDVRPGDRIDAAYTVRGLNPVLADHYVDEFRCGWSVPVARARVRILCPPGRPLFSRMLGGQQQPVRSTVSGLEEYLWEFQETSAFPAEDQTPSWHVTAPWLQVSEFPDWAAVVRWALPLYPPAALPPELERLVEGWRIQFPGPLERAAAALDWMQKNVRYVGLHLGAGTYRPSSPETVLQRRFGDCKDQSYLFCTLLHRLGLEAAPVLVSTWGRRQVADLLPSPHVFDHVVTRLRSGNRTCYVDPTDCFQRGALENRYMPDYGYGLVVAEGQTGLLRFGSHQGEAPEIEIEMRFLTEGEEQPAVLEVDSIARGGAAGERRQMAAASRADELSSAFLNYFAARYPGIEEAAEPQFVDDPVKNEYRIRERYNLPDFWVSQPESDGFRAAVFADAVIDAIPRPQTKVRTTPLAVDHPRRVLQRIRIELPEPWPDKKEDKSFRNAAFELRVQRRQEARTTTLTYDYQTRSDHVPAAEMAKYQRAILDLDSELGYELTFRPGGGAVGRRPLNTTLLLVGAVSLALLAAAAALAYRRVSLAGREAPLLEEGAAQGLPRGLGGWLTLVGINLAIRPIYSVVELARMGNLYFADSWYNLTNPAGAAFHPLWAAYILSDVVLNLAIVAASILLLLFFFQRRRVFPRAYIWFLVAQVVIAFVNIGLGRLVLGSQEAGSSPAQAVGAVVGSGIWIAYMLRSVRVKLTFTR